MKQKIDAKLYYDLVCLSKMRIIPKTVDILFGRPCVALSTLNLEKRIWTFSSM